MNFLMQTSSYSEQAKSIKSIETHMSWIFLTGQHACKLRKPIQLEFVDFSSLAAHHQSAQHELMLNNQLAPGIYLEVIPLMQDSSGHLHLGSSSGHANKVVDWLLKMKRLPERLLLDHAIAKNNISFMRLHQAVQRLVDFYRVNRSAVFTADEYRLRLSGRIRENYQILSLPIYGLNKDILNAVFSTQMAKLEEWENLFSERVEQGWIVEGHGDLRPEHICLTAPPVFFDRPELESSDKAIDPLEELSLLYIECKLLGHPEVGQYFFTHYRDLSGDNYPPPLSVFHQSLCALNRAKFSVWHLDDPSVRDKDRFQHRASSYLALAAVISD